MQPFLSDITAWMIDQQDYQAELEAIKEAENYLFLASLEVQDKTTNSLSPISKR